MKRVILCPNPYRDDELTVAKRSREILEHIGFETVVCLPFNREGYGDQLGVPIRQLQQEIKRADLLIAFGGDGTILHLARTVALHNVPVLGINLGSLGFMSELEPNELERLNDLKNWNFSVESRMMLDVTVLREGKPAYNNIALNDAVGSAGCVHGGGSADEDHRRRRHRLHAYRLHGLLHGGGRPYCGAYGAKSAADADLPSLHTGQQLCAVAGSYHYHRGGGRQPEVRLSLRGRRQGILPEKRGQGAGTAVQIHHKAGAALQEELLRDTGFKNGNGGSQA